MTSREVVEPRREVGLLDLVFLSLGGQSPFLSVLVYGVATFMIAGYFAPIAIVLGTLLVLVNGLVVYRLSVRFTSEGGYYTYAYYSLSRRLGFETGWAYLLYASFYGAAYALGSAYVISLVLHYNPLAVLSAILLVSSLLALSGKRPSFRYAIFAAALEIAVMAILAVSFLAATKFTLYNPLSRLPDISQMALAAVFGAGIPTGYGSITPLSGEVKDPRRTVPRAVITVILMGGLLAAFDIYAIVDHLLFYHLNPTGVEILSLIKDEFGVVTLLLVLFAAINDGILATMTFMFATSRTIFAMAYHGFFPRAMAKLVNGSEPFNAVAVTVAAYWIISYSSLAVLGYDLQRAFIAVSLISMFANLYVHLAADFSLFKISLKRFRKRIPEISLSIASIVFTTYIFVQSLPSSTSTALTIFLFWLVLGFFIVEIIEMSKEEEEE
ncbi:MAG: APC family permease [Pyrobaculum sp.]